MLRAEKLTKVYPDGVIGLQSLDLEVAPGEIVCLLGANGAGKTTTINLFLDFIEPSQGRCLINGIEVARAPLEAKKYVAYLPENVMLYSNFTAYQNLSFFAQIAGKKKPEREECSALLDLVGLSHDSFDRKVRTFSKGMRQKLGIAIAVIKSTPALILDEPMSGLDPGAASELVKTLSALRDDGKAILMSTHDIFRAKFLASRIAIMSRGRKVLELERQELEHQNLEELYISYIDKRAGTGAG